MWPRLAEFEVLGHTLTLHAYGLMIAVGGTAWIVLVARETTRRGLERMRAHLIWVLLAMIAAGWIGGKALHALLSGLDPGGAAQPPGTGFVFYGSLLAAIPTFVLVARRLSIPPWVGLDVLLSPGPLLHAFGRTGCFLAGCCHGHRCDLPWAVTFRDGWGLNGVALHPVQLYEAAGELALFLWIWFVLRRRQRFDGQLALTFLIGYACLRLVTETFRGDERAILLGNAAVGEATSGLSSSSLVSLILLLVCVGLWTRRAGSSRS